MEIARLYTAAQRSFVALCDDLTDREWQTTVPCTPDWTVWDVLSHVAGVADDIVHGRVDGAATDPWTATQVDRWRHTPRAALIGQWTDQVEQAGAIVQAVGEARPPLDCHNHEHDVRHALGRPANRESEIIRWAVELFSDASVGRAVEIDFTDGGAVALEGAAAPIGLSGVSRFELMRARLGRRSRAQVTAYAWSEPPGDELLGEWFVFGPSPLDIIE